MPVGRGELKTTPVSAWVKPAAASNSECHRGERANGAACVHADQGIFDGRAMTDAKKAPWDRRRPKEGH
jgi:hypothetical protein